MVLCCSILVLLQSFRVEGTPFDFLNEVEVLASLRGQPGVLQVHAVVMNGPRLLGVITDLEDMDARQAQQQSIE